MEKLKEFTIEHRDVPANPPLEFAKKMVEKARGAEKVVSIGGGSTIDVGKYVSYKLNIPHKAIPTTGGTGSEVTRFAVFIDKGKKISLEDDRLIPEEYLLNPSLLTTLSSSQTACSGLDALSQAIESYWSPNSTNASRSDSERAIKCVMSSLWFSYQYPKSEIFRKKMLEAANYSGRAINVTKTSICHAISYPLTIRYGIPHGVACAITLPFFMRYFEFTLVKAWEVEALLKSLKISIRKDLNLDYIIKEALSSERARNVPKKVTAYEIKKSILANEL